MAKFTYNGEAVKVYVDFADGDHTLEAVPGSVYDLPEAPDANFVASGKATPAPVEAPQSAPEAPVEPSN